MVKVSVIIPCYNAEKYLDQCINSVRNQTLQDIQIICVDDGSTDRTRQMLREYEATDPRIKVLFQQNKFAGVARNTGMDVAEGEYLAFLDADDYYEPDGLEKAYEIAKTNNLEMLKLSSYLLDDQTGEITTNAHYSHERFVQKNRVVKFEDAPKNMLNCADVAWNGLYSRKFIEDNQLRFNNFRCVNDRSFYINCMLTAKRIMVADVYLTCYRRNIAGSLVSIRHKFFDCQINSYKLIREIVSKAACSKANKNLIMQFELNQIFIWYEKFLNSGVNTFYVEKIIRDFVAEFDVSDVGEEFLPKFQRKQFFYRFKESLKIRWQREPMAEPAEISVVVPSYNGIRYLSECIESILLQSFERFELIFVDDGSTDATAELMEGLAGEDCRIKVIRQEQSGAGVARNRAVQSASGKYITFVDGDDKIKPDFLQKLYEAAEKHSADVVVTQRIAWFGTGAGSVMRNWITSKRLPQGKVFCRTDVPDYILNFTDGAPGGKLFRLDFVRKHDIRYLPIRRSEDFYFIFSAFVQAERMFFLDYSGYYYRKNNAGSLENTKDETPLLFWEATAVFKEKLIELGCLDEIKRSYLNNTINRVAFNMKAVKTYEGFAAIFDLLKEICDTELELNDHEKKYFFDDASYNYLMPLLKYETAGECLHGEYLSQIQQINDLKRKLNEANTKLKNMPADEGLVSLARRKFRGFLNCISDHGLWYTMKYAVKKLLGKTN